MTHFIPLLITQAALALPTTLCEPARDIDHRINTCDDNMAFVQAAQACLDQIQSFNDQLAKAALAKGFSRDLDSSQLAKFVSTQEDYQKSSADLAQVIALAGIAAGDLAAYPTFVNPPAGYFIKLAEEGKEAARKFENAHDCYAGAQKKLQSVRDALTAKTAELQASKAAVDSMAVVASGRTTQVGSLASDAKTATGAYDNVPSGESRNPASTITGVKEEKLKEGIASADLRAPVKSQAIVTFSAAPTKISPASISAQNTGRDTGSLSVSGDLTAGSQAEAKGPQSDAQWAVASILDPAKSRVGDICTVGLIADATSVRGAEFTAELTGANGAASADSQNSLAQLSPSADEEGIFERVHNAYRRNQPQEHP